LGSEEVKYQMTIEKTTVAIMANEVVVKSKDFLQKISLKNIKAIDIRVDLKLMILGIVLAILGLILYRIGGWLITLFSIFVIVDSWKRRFVLTVYFDGKALRIRDGEKLKILASKIREYASL